MIVREDRSAPVVAIVTYLKVGYFDELDEQAGISHVLEHMFFKGTPTRGPGEIAQETKAAGGILNAATIYDHTYYYTVLPSSSFERGLAIQSDALIRSTIDADELSRELQVIIQEAKRKLDNPAAVAQETLYELLYDKHRIRRWRIGTESFLRGLTRDQLWSYYKTMYRGASAVLVVAGDVNAETAFAEIERYYDELPAGNPARDRGPAEPERAEFRFREQSGDIVQLHTELGWQTVGALHEDTPALDLLGIVLGQGRASRLYRTVRDAGLVHSIAARNYTPTDLGVFEVSLELQSENLLPALEAVTATIAGASKEINEEELERAKRILEARVVRRLETAEGQANYLAEWAAQGDWQFGQQYLDNVGQVSANDLIDAAERYLRLERAAVFSYRPQADAPLGWSAERLYAQLSGVRSCVPAPPELTTPVPAGRTQRAGAARSEDGVHMYETSSGVRVIVKPRHGAPLASIALALPGGANTETEATAGFTSLLARVSVKGTRSRSAAQLALAAEALGASIAPNVTPDLLNWYMGVPARHFDAALELVVDSAMAPTFPEEELERERAIALADLQQVRDDMYRYPLRLFLHGAFPQHPYGFTLAQAEAALQAASSAGLRAWHAEVVAKAQPWIIVAGDVDADKVAEAVAARVEARVQARVESRSPVWPDAPVRVEESRDKRQTAIVLAFPGVHRNHPDLPALQLLANAVAGLGGRLFEELRSKRSLAYTVAAYPVARALAGSFVSYIATSPEREAEARAGLLEELGRLRAERLPDDELERAREYTVGSWQIRSQSNAAQVSDLMHALIIGEGLSEIREYEQRMRAVSAENIRDVAQRYFDEQRLVEAVVRGTGGGR